MSCSHWKVHAVVDSTTGGFTEFVGMDPATISTNIYNGREKSKTQSLTLDTNGLTEEAADACTRLL